MAALTCQDLARQACHASSQPMSVCQPGALAASSPDVQRSERASEAD